MDCCCVSSVFLTGGSEDALYQVCSCSCRSVWNKPARLSFTVGACAHNSTQARRLPIPRSRRLSRAPERSTPVLRRTLVGGSFDMCVGFDERWVCLLKERWVLVFEERGVCLLNSITEGTYKTMHTEALGSTILRYTYIHTNTDTDRGA